MTSSKTQAHFNRHDDLVYSTSRWQRFLFDARRNNSDALRVRVN